MPVLNGLPRRSCIVRAAGGDFWQAVVDDWRTAPLRPELAATLIFLTEQLTLRPDELTHDHADAVRAAGVSDQALQARLRSVRSST